MNARAQHGGEAPAELIRRSRATAPTATERARALAKAADVLDSLDRSLALEYGRDSEHADVSAMLRAEALLADPPTFWTLSELESSAGLRGNDLELYFEWAWNRPAPMNIPASVSEWWAAHTGRSDALVPRDPAGTNTYPITCRACGNLDRLKPEETAWGNLCRSCQRIATLAVPGGDNGYDVTIEGIHRSGVKWCPDGPDGRDNPCVTVAQEGES